MTGIELSASPTFAHVGGCGAALAMVGVVGRGRQSALAAEGGWVGQHSSEHTSHPTLLQYAVNEHGVGVRDDDGVSALGSLHCPQRRHGLVVDTQPAGTGIFSDQ